MSEFHLRPVALVHNHRIQTEDDHWGGIISQIVLEPCMPVDSLDGLEDFSHIEVIFLFHLVEEDRIVSSSRHPRDNPNWPKVGIFAQRGRTRPNWLGVSVAKVLRRDGRSLSVEGLDAVDGTPVLDIKPVMLEFLPRGPILQPDWSHELMREYW